MIKLTWPGFNAQGTVIMALAPEVFSLSKTPVVIDGELFEAKDELHITLIGTELGLVLQQKISSDQSVERLLAKTFEEIDWTFKKTGPVHLLSRVKDAAIEKSVILLLKMDGVKTFYEQIKTLGLIDVATPVPPPHITLYTKNCANGIGISSDSKLKLFSDKTMSISTLKNCVIK